MRADGPADGYLLWKLHDFRPGVASVRTRCLLPGNSLARLGIRSVVLSRREALPAGRSLPGAVVFVKTFTARDVRLADWACRHGIPVIVDLCDNIYLPEFRGVRGERTRSIFHQLCARAAAIVTTGPELARVILDHSGFSGPIEEIPDQLETLADARQIFCHGAGTAGSCRGVGRHLLAGFRRVSAQLLAVRHRLVSVPPPAGGPLRLVWFGTQGKHGISGMRSLAARIPELSRAFAVQPFELAVVSNNQLKFWRLFSGTPFVCRYYEWDPLGIFGLLESSDLCLVPNSRDFFSVTKSANRPAMALGTGIPCAVDMVPALEPLRDVLFHEGWDERLAGYLQDNARRLRDVRKGQGLVRSLYGGDEIARRWLDLLGRLRVRCGPEDGPPPPP